MAACESGVHAGLCKIFKTVRSSLAGATESSSCSRWLELLSRARVKYIRPWQNQSAAKSCISVSALCALPADRRGTMEMQGEGLGRGISGKEGPRDATRRRSCLAGFAAGPPRTPLFPTPRSLRCESPTPFSHSLLPHPPSLSLPYGTANSHTGLRRDFVLPYTASAMPTRPSPIPPQLGDTRREGGSPLHRPREELVL